MFHYEIPRACGVCEHGKQSFDGLDRKVWIMDFGQILTGGHGIWATRFSKASMVFSFVLLAVPFLEFIGVLVVIFFHPACSCPLYGLCLPLNQHVQYRDRISSKMQFYYKSTDKKSKILFFYKREYALSGD